MIENIGSIANAFADDMGRGSELHRRLETVVRAVEIVAGALQARSAVMARQVEQEYARAARNVGQLIDRLVRERADLESARGNQNRRDYRRRPTAEREQEVSVRLSVMLGERLDRFRVPESVREFLLTVWLRQLRTAALRDGEESGEFKVAMQVVDDLLWSLNPDVEPGGRRELALRIPPLIRMLTQGMRDIGVKDEELKPFFDELFLVHLRKMQGEEGAPSARRKSMSRTLRSAAVGATSVSVPAGQPPPVPARAPRTRIAAPPIPTSLRRRPESEPTSSRGDTVPDTLPDTLPRASRAAEPAPLPTPRASVPPAVAARPASKAGAPANQELLDVLSSIDLGDLPRQPRAVRLADADPLAHLARGVWLQLDSQEGETVHAKVAWINSRRTAVLMVRHPDRRAVSMGTTELAQRFAQGRAFLIE
ncbi:MAG: DUF1631 family protein [Burkholderiales bacterium]|nr:DUF1631 family protein [Burkholderiales bacterium]